MEYSVTAVRADGIPVRYLHLTYKQALEIFDEITRAPNIAYAQYGRDEDKLPLNVWCKDAEFVKLEPCGKCGRNRVKS